MNMDLETLLAIEGDAAEQNMDAPEKPGTIATRPGGTRSVVFSVRLSPSEVSAVELEARRSGVSASTLVRRWLTEKIAENDEERNPHNIALWLRACADRVDELVPA